MADRRRPSRSRPVVEGVLLDLDDTLIDTQAAFRTATRAVATRWLPHLDDQAVVEAARRWARDPGGHFRAYTRGELGFLEQRRRRVTDLHAAYGGPVLDDDEFGRWEAVYDAAFRAAWALHEDVAAFLDELAESGVATGALTNATREISLAKLDRLGLADRLTLLVSPDDLGVGKPDRQVFQLACDRLGTAPERTAYVGDELDIDAQGARAAGLVGIWLDRLGPRSQGPAPATDGVLVARTLRDVSRLVDLGGHSARR
jgi:putative hydrolase of the HAD superfamily